MSSDPIRIDLSGLGRTDGKAGEHAGTAGRARFLSVRSVFVKSIGLAILAVLPFLAMVRVSVYLHQHQSLSGWGSVVGGVLATILILLVYLISASFRLGKKGRVPRVVRRAAVLFVVVYAGYALLYLSSSNVKSDDVRATYTRLTPVLRVAVSTLLLVDRQGILTSAGRTERDYEAWGLPVNEASLHLPQEDGFVYAVDVRTIGRKVWQNVLVEGYFRAMGFQTVRHAGTADHLHVALPPNR